MAPYSMDLRTRVLADCDAGVAAKEVAAKFRVSRSWVNRVVQRRRETGEVGPRPQTVFKKQAFAGQEDRLRALVDAQPDRTLAELREALHELGQPVVRLARVGSAPVDAQKKRYTPRNNAAPTSRLSGGAGASSYRSTMCGSTSFSMNAASPPICYVATAGARAARASAITRPAVTGRRTR